MTHIFLINLPSNHSKKPYDRAFNFTKTINFGLLSIATYLKNKGLSVSIFDPYSQDYDNYEESIILEVQKAKPLAIGLSCISGFCYPPLKDIAKLLKSYLPDTAIIVGGKDHVGLILKDVLQECPEVDILIKGEAEETTFQVIKSMMNGNFFSRIPNIAYRDKDGSIKITDFTDSVALSIIPSLDYKLYPNYLSLPPIIEVSRGCPYSCKFCVNTGSKVRKKSIADITKDIKLIIELYEIENPALYFEAPMFIFSDQEIEGLIDIKKKEGLNFTWRAETRVDYLTPQRIERLTMAGLKVVDLGLESASPEILLLLRAFN
jgi:anaerobic magnesium-protoporphyrin IX monomethyl ester cyclase